MGKQLSISAITEVFSFAVSDCARIDGLVKAGDRECYARECGLSSGLPAERGPFPRGHYPCSHVAILKLAEVAQIRIESDLALRDRINFDSYFGPLKAELGVRCIKMREPITDQLAREVLEAAKAEAVRKKTSATYFFPVFAADETPSVECYKLGAVEFERTRRFFGRTTEQWESSIALNIEDWTAEAKASGHEANGDYFRGNYRRLKEHFLEHLWLASVRIDDAEDDIGYAKAERIIDQTCTLLRLFLPGERGAFIGVSKHRRYDRDTARFMFSKESRYEYMLSGGASQGDTVQSGSLSRLRTYLGFAEIEATLAKLSGWDSLTKAELRLVSALGWFGEAWKEDHYEAKIVKFAMCLESLIMTGGKEGITELLAERVALLLGTDYETRLNYFSKAKEVYGARSQAVHGDSAQSEIDFRGVAKTAEDLARGVMLAYSQIVPILGKTKNVEQALGDFFTALKLGGMEAGRAALQKLSRESVKS